MNNLCLNPEESETSDPCILVLVLAEKKPMLEQVMNLLVSMTYFLLCPFFFVVPLPLLALGSDFTSLAHRFFVHWRREYYAI